MLFKVSNLPLHLLLYVLHLCVCRIQCQLSALKLILEDFNLLIEMLHVVGAFESCDSRLVLALSQLRFQSRDFRRELALRKLVLQLDYLCFLLFSLQFSLKGCNIGCLSSGLIFLRRRFKKSLDLRIKLILCLHSFLNCRVSFSLLLLHLLLYSLNLFSYLLLILLGFLRDLFCFNHYGFFFILHGYNPISQHLILGLEFLRELIWERIGSMEDERC